MLLRKPSRYGSDEVLRSLCGAYFYISPITTSVHPDAPGPGALAQFRTIAFNDFPYFSDGELIFTVDDTTLANGSSDFHALIDMSWGIRLRAFHWF